MWSGAAYLRRLNSVSMWSGTKALDFLTVWRTNLAPDGLAYSVEHLLTSPVAKAQTGTS